MRYDQNHKEATRRHILQIAITMFAEQGVESVSVAGLMAAAGLTHGGFYNHFSSKDDLLKAAVAEAFANARDELVASPAGENGADAIDALLGVGRGASGAILAACASLTSEVGRRDDALREAYSAAFSELAGALADRLTGLPRAGRAEVASLILAQLMGALEVARALAAGERRKRLLRAASRDAHRIALNGIVGRGPPQPARSSATSE